jgi:hypothetical protein
MPSPRGRALRGALVVVGVAAVAAMVLFGWIHAAAQVKAPAPATSARVVATPLRPALSTDLKIDGIFGAGCKCDLADVDAVYMGRINVSVSNNYMKSGGATTESVLTVTYFDMKLARQVTVTKNLTALKPYPTNPWAFQEYGVVTTPRTT